MQGFGSEEEVRVTGRARGSQGEPPRIWVHSCGPKRSGKRPGVDSTEASRAELQVL